MHHKPRNPCLGLMDKFKLLWNAMNASDDLNLLGGSSVRSLMRRTRATFQYMAVQTKSYKVSLSRIKSLYTNEMMIMKM